MEEEILYIENLSTGLTSGRNIDHVSFSLRKGEILGITGLSNSGISALAGALTGELSPSTGHIYLNGAPVRLTSRKQANSLGIYEIRHSLSIIKNLSVAENLNVLRRFVWRDFLIRKRRNAETTRMVFSRYGIRGDPDGGASGLTKGQQTELSICRALLCGAQVLVCQEVGEGFSEEEFAEFRRFLHKIRDEGTPIITLHSDARKVLQLADRVAVVRSGMICYQRPVQEAELDKICLCVAGKSSEGMGGKPQKPKEPALTLRGVSSPEFASRELNAELYAGAVQGIYWEASTCGNAVYQIFSGLLPASGTVVENGRAWRFADWRQKNRKRILCLGMRFWQNGLYENMTVAENLALQTYSRYDDRGGMMNRRMLRLALAEFTASHGIDPDCLARYPYHLAPELRNRIVLWSALFAHPKLLVLDCPMYTMDEQLRRHFLSCLGELRAAGTVILWSSNNGLTLESYCDHVVKVGQA